MNKNKFKSIPSLIVALSLMTNTTTGVIVNSQEITSLENTTEQSSVFSEEQSIQELTTAEEVTTEEVTTEEVTTEEALTSVEETTESVEVNTVDESLEISSEEPTLEAITEVTTDSTEEVIGESLATMAQISAIDSTVPGAYEAYHEKDFVTGEPVNDGHNLYVRPAGTTETGEVVYCYNASKNFPYADGDTRIQQHTKINATSSDFELSADSPRLSGDELKNSVLKVIYNGYNSDTTQGVLQQTLGVDNDTMRDATQLAIWYFTDNYGLTAGSSYPGGYSSEEVSIARQLVGLDSNPSIMDVPYDADATLNIFQHYGPGVTDNYQHLLGAKFVDANTGEEITTTVEETTAEETTVEETTAEETTVEETTVEETTAEETTVEETTAEETTSEETTVEETTAEETTVEETTVEETTAEETTVEETTVEETTVEETTAEETTVEETAEETTVEETTAEETTVEETTAEETTVEETTAEETTVEETTAEETTVEETTEGKTTEEKTTEGKTTEENTTEGKTTEEKTTEGKTTEETIVVKGSKNKGGGSSSLPSTGEKETNIFAAFAVMVSGLLVAFTSRKKYEQE